MFQSGQLIQSLMPERPQGRDAMRRIIWVLIAIAAVLKWVTRSNVKVEGLRALAYSALY
jgi:hypothetical protein